MDLTNLSMDKFIDIHAHLSDRSFDGNREDLISRLEGYIVLNAGENPAENEKVLSLESSSVLKCIGLHPNYVSSASENEIANGLDFLSANVNKAFALSEVGLDYKNKTDAQKKTQVSILGRIFELAEKNNKVCIVHSRNSISELIDLSKSFKARVIIHNFEGNWTSYTKAVDAGIGISVSTGFMKFKKDSLLRKMDLSFLFTETDSPVLSPDNKINTPLNIPRLLNYIAGIRSMDSNELKQIIAGNLVRFFHD